MKLKRRDKARRQSNTLQGPQSTTHWKKQTQDLSALKKADGTNALFKSTRATGHKINFQEIKMLANEGRTLQRKIRERIEIENLTT